MTATEPIYDADGNEIEPSHAMQEARAAADRADAARAAAERRATLLELLPPIENKAQRAMFLDSYKGDLTEEAVTGALVELGLAAPPKTPDEIAQEQQDAAAQDARQDLATGALGAEEQPDPELVQDPSQLGLQKFNEAKRLGATDKNASAQFTDRVVSAAVRGDERALWKGWTDDQLNGYVDV